jgi:hypothetical protein
MTKEQARELREEWKFESDHETCIHSLLVMESKDKGGVNYLPGSYFCACCGEHVIRKKR